MICKNYKEGKKLRVAELNEIVVLIDRSETALTEVGLNIWRADLTGPVHAHDQKEQIFYVTSGTGIVIVGSAKYEVKPQDLIYVPAGVKHRTIAGAKGLEYFLFNAFLTADKEGDSSFADHIDRVKDIRTAQTQQTISGWGKGTPTTSKKGKYICNIEEYEGKRFDFGSNATILLLDRIETERCEATLVIWPSDSKGPIVAHKDKEQTFFILSGTGWVTIADETMPIKPGDVVFVPYNTPHTTKTDDE
ncbi:MAG: cupin domain-containing protein, partial [Candidatus Aerophobetes bacterium]|nr:cupin domain-containing protein [Candidatus Aerophobetes bacterium]